MIGNKRGMAWVLLAAFGLGPGSAAPQTPETLVERVELQGNRYLRNETLLYYVSTKVGDRYDEARLREDFHRLWDTGFLEDLGIEVLDGPGGKIVVFRVQERKRIQIVDYRGSKALSNTEIEERLKEKDAELKIDTFYDLGRARKTEVVIRDLLREKGRGFGTVTHREQTLGGAGTQVTFTIDDGPKTKVTEVDFVGNRIFSDATLRGHMKKIKQGGFWNLSWLGGKRTYTPEKWAEDQQSIREFYLNHGYVTATVGEPKLSYSDGGSPKKPLKRLKIEVPVTEGDQYRVGRIEVAGLTLFKEEFVRSLFKLRTGDVYKESRIEKGYEKLREYYGAQGYFQWTALTKRSPDPQRRVVDLVLSMEEDKRYFVGRINFAGNDSTRDKVIRREVYLTEGEVFNTELLKLSIRRINQLGYFKPMEGVPELQPNSAAEDKIDVTFKVEEQNRNQFTFGGGVSGLEGTFLNASFSTANFLGLGETLQLSAQSGRRTKNYQFAVTEPYLFDRPITAGIDIFKRRLEYRTLVEENVQGYIDDRVGTSLLLGLPLGRFTRLFTSYSYEIVKVEITEDAELDPIDVLQPTVVNPYYLQDAGERRESRLTPSLVFNTVDNPWTPRSGTKQTLSFQVAGGPLGGTINYLRPDLESVFYIPHTRRTALGIRAQVGWIRPFSGTAEVDPETGRNGLPFYQRFYMGGENQIRGYNIRSVAPRDENEYLLGGNKFGLLNAEYYIDIMGPLRLVLFFDAGQTFLEGERIKVSDFLTSTGVELRFFMPVLNIPFRLIYAINPNRDPEHYPRTTFKFAVGTTF